MQCSLMFLAFLVSSGLIAGRVGAAERAVPVRIGGLTEGFEPTTGSAGLREGLTDLGSHENKAFVIGIRFTQGDTSALPVAGRELGYPGAAGGTEGSERNAMNGSAICSCPRTRTTNTSNAKG